MFNDLYIDIFVDRHGVDAPKVALDMAASREKSGDAAGAAFHRRMAEAAKIKLVKNSEELNRKNSVNPLNSDLYAGITNITVHSEFKITDGLIIRPIKAYIMTPYIIRYTDEPPGTKHSKPWKSASGSEFAINSEIFLHRNCTPLSFDRLNTIWWLAALIRMHHAHAIRVPVISDTSFLEHSESKLDPTLWPREVSPIGMAFDGVAWDGFMSKNTIEWLQNHFLNSSTLLESESFRLSFLAFDKSHSSTSMSEAMLLIWSAIEALFRPGRSRITHRLCAAISCYLESEKSGIDRFYNIVRELYEKRGEISHAARAPDAKSVVESYDIARRCIVKSLEVSSLPSTDELMEKYKIEHRI